MSLRASALIAIAGVTLGLAIVYLSSWILELALSWMPEETCFVVWLPLQLLAFASILGGLLTFYATYLNAKRARRDTGTQGGREQGAASRLDDGEDK